MLRRLVLPFAGLCLAAARIGAVHADDCPNAQTAKLGFVLERQGIRAEIRPNADRFVHARNLYGGGRSQDVIYYGGLIEISRFDDTARRINIPMSDLRSVLPLDAKARRVLTYAPADPGRVGALVSLELTVTGQERVQLGACDYAVLVVRNRSMAADGKVLSEYSDLFAPDLGFVLAKRYAERAGGETTVSYKSIRPLSRTAPL
ncbi:MAG: hypothetical protein ABWY78_24165 [Microvirga sp.]